MVGVAELESATPCVSCKCSNQLSYTPGITVQYGPHLTRIFQWILDYKPAHCKTKFEKIYYSAQTNKFLSIQIPIDNYSVRLKFFISFSRTAKLWIWNVWIWNVLFTKKVEPHVIQNYTNLQFSMFALTPDCISNCARKKLQGPASRTN